MSQQQFLNVIDRDEAEARFHQVLHLGPLPSETVRLEDALGRVLAEDIVSAVDVPSFDRSNYDGFAVQATDTFGASEYAPRQVRLLGETILPGIVPEQTVKPGTAMAIATGGMVPRGADSVVMVEHTDDDASQLTIRRAVTPGFGITFAGTDIASGETVLRRGDVLTSRETGVLAAIGVDRVTVVRRPRVAVISTGDEIIPVSQPMRPGLIYDSNARILADAIREWGGQPQNMGIVRDNLDELRLRLKAALLDCDAVLLSGGTSKGQGDLSYRVVSELSDPGIVAHGVALKPGKPICLAATQGKPVVILPGFPTSAIFTFHEFVAPVLRQLAGLPAISRSMTQARMAVKVNSEIGRTEYLLVGLSAAGDTGPDGVSLVAYPMGKGSGSVTTFSRADGFVTIDRRTEIVEAGEVLTVQLLGKELRLADLTVIGSHCVGLDYLLGQLQSRGFQTKFLAVGSTAGLEAVRRGECDLAGCHLMDPETGQYNRPFLDESMLLISGYGRMQGVVYRVGDRRFDGLDAKVAVEAVKREPDCIMVNRNRGSGTRILIDRLLDGTKPAGYPVQARSHNAVAAAVSQGRADWGVAIQGVAEAAGLGFLPLAEEQYDFILPKSRAQRPAVRAFQQLLQEPGVREQLSSFGFRLPPRA